MGTKQSGVVEAILDTGFDGYLSLPINIAVSLGLELIAVVPVEYADGRTSQELVSTMLTAGAEPLAGISLFADYEMRLNFPKQKINLEKIP